MSYLPTFGWFWGVNGARPNLKELPGNSAPRRDRHRGDSGVLPDVPGKTRARGKAASTNTVVPTTIGKHPTEVVWDLDDKPTQVE